MNTTSTDRHRGIVEEWVDRFTAVLCAPSDQDLSLDSIFVEDCWWRDVLSFTDDLHTFRGREDVRRFLISMVRERHEGNFDLVDGQQPRRVVREGHEWIESLLRFETTTSRGTAVLRLIESSPGEWRAWTLATAMDELKGHEAARNSRRVRTVGRCADSGECNWSRARSRQREFLDEEPHVLIVGAGQSGLSLAAHLAVLGVPALIVEKNARVGDNWRSRYDSLTLHDPVWVNELPFLPYPDSWPLYTPKDKIADWLESYASIMELNVWTDSSLLAASYDRPSTTWQVSVERADGTRRTLYPSQVVMATGNTGEPYIPDISGIDQYSGSAYHSSAHGTGEGSQGQRVVIIGSCTSAHDIAKDFCEHGADVTMIQRSSTYIISQEKGVPELWGAYYDATSDPTHIADYYYLGFPNPVHIELSKGLTSRIADLDRDLLASLERVGFRLDQGTDGSGLLGKALRRRGGYYIDVGASQLIADGRIAVKSGVELQRLSTSGAELSDGTHLGADRIVFATGFTNMRDSVRGVLGDEIAEECGQIGGMDDEGEIANIWRRSGHPGLWIMGGSLQLARIYSKYLALQLLKAQLELRQSNDALKPDDVAALA